MRPDTGPLERCCTLTQSITRQKGTAPMKRTRKRPGSLRLGRNAGLRIPDLMVIRSLPGCPLWMECIGGHLTIVSCPPSPPIRWAMVTRWTSWKPWAVSNFECCILTTLSIIHLHYLEANNASLGYWKKYILLSGVRVTVVVSVGVWQIGTSVTKHWQNKEELPAPTTTQQFWRNKLLCTAQQNPGP